MFRLTTILCLLLATPLVGQEQPKLKPYRLPAVDLKQRIIWDAQCKEPEGSGLAFGGQDQEAREVRAITRIWQDGWVFVDLPMQRFGKQHVDVERVVFDFWTRQRRQFFMPRINQALVTAVGGFAASDALRFHEIAWFQIGQLRMLADNRLRILSVDSLSRPHVDKQIKQLKSEIYACIAEQVISSSLNLDSLSESINRIGLLIERLRVEECMFVHGLPSPVEFDHWLKSFDATYRTSGRIGDWQAELNWILHYLDAANAPYLQSPPPRALAAIAYDPKSKLYVMFGGDHLDHLMNDTWVFDMTTKRWTPRFPKDAPPPRANHKLIANGDGTITLKGGYTYANNTDYMGGQYIDISDGDWTYDIAKNEWTGKGKPQPPFSRVYRSGPFHPSYYLRDPKPDANAFAKWLDALPVNEWKKTNPPHLPHLNRDWGTAVIDPDHDLILRWSGGHCAHGGTDVLHYHLATNRWELTQPVEFPLGQLYTNTEYPEGWNFNKRPWITGHTYQSYGYDSFRKRMVFAGQPKHFYFYDPVKGDWDGERLYKPKGMSYNSCFYTLTMTPTPRGLVCWTAEGKLFLNEQVTLQWVEQPIKGEKLPGSVVDNSTLAYDSKRDRLLFFRKGYGDKSGYDGQIFEVDCKTLTCKKLDPEGMKEAGSIPYLCQIRYDAENDVTLVGATLPPDADGIRRPPAYDCAKNRWVSMKIIGDDPSGNKGRNVSLGLMYDSKRKLWWAVDAKSQVFVLKLDPKTADVRGLIIEKDN